MGWWSRRREEAHEERERQRRARDVDIFASMGKAFGEALGNVLSAQGNLIDQNTKFLDNLQDLSARKAAQVLGSRGGKRSQARKRQASLPQTDCAVCHDPSDPHLTVRDIDIHRAHGTRRHEALPEQPPPAPVPLPQVEMTYPNGNGDGM